MAIDLSKCTGCAKCVVGCQAENNIPIVGRHGILDGRPMAWMRIDRYYDAPPKESGWDAAVWDGPLDVVESEPQRCSEPMLCQHCENAPCETVSVLGDDAQRRRTESADLQPLRRHPLLRQQLPVQGPPLQLLGNEQAAGQHVLPLAGASYCQNAELNTRPPMQMKNNPEVTVRSRGVMEKCSFCVQRIRLARAEATRNGTDRKTLPDGAVVPACMEACPSKAITFGNLHAPGSRTALASSPRAMKLLDSVGVNRRSPT